MANSFLTHFSSIFSRITPRRGGKLLSSRTASATPSSPSTFGANSNKPAGKGDGSEEFEASIVLDFLKMMDYDIEQPVYECPPELTDGVQRTIDSWNLAPEYKQPVMKAVVPAICVSHMPFRRYSTELKIYLTIYTALAIYIDNVMGVQPEIMIPELRKLPARWGLGLLENSYEDPIIGLYMRHVTLETPKHYGPYGTGVIVKGSIDYLIGCLLEGELPDRMQVPKTASRWTSFFRGKTGMGELYAHFIFPQEQFKEPHHLESFVPTVPDIAELINKINDVCSYYKECVVSSEDYNFVMTESRRTGLTPVQILRQICHEQVELVREVKEALAAHPLAHEAFSGFINGYLMYHCTNSRYRLYEIGVHLGQKQLE